MTLLGQPVGLEERWVAAGEGGGVRVERHRAYRFQVDGEAVEDEVVTTAVLDASGRLRELESRRGADRVHARVTGAELELVRLGESERRPISGPLHLLDEPSEAHLQVLQGGFGRVCVLDPGSFREREVALRGLGEGWIEWDDGLLQGSLRLHEGEVVAVRGGGIAVEAVEVAPELGEVDLSRLLRRGRGVVDDPRRVRTLLIRFSGPPPAHSPPVQVVEGDVVKVQVPLPFEVPASPVRADTPQLGEWLAAELGLPVGHPELVAEVESLLGGVVDRREAVERLVGHVRERVVRHPTPGMGDGLVALQVGSGDCSERAVALVALARTAGIPARVVSGVVWAGSPGGFYPHAWAELYLEQPAGWVPVDPSFGQQIADATHLKLATGTLDTQWRVLTRLPDLDLEVVEAR